MRGIMFRSLMPTFAAVLFFAVVAAPEIRQTPSAADARGGSWDNSGTIIFAPMRSTPSFACLQTEEQRYPLRTRRRPRCWRTSAANGGLTFFLTGRISYMCSLCTGPVVT